MDQSDSTMFMLYNAVIRTFGSSKVEGRIFIKDLKEVPEEYLVEYRGGFISKQEDLGSLFCSLEEPLHLVYIPPEVDILLVTTKKDNGKVLAFEFTETLTVGELKQKIRESQGISVYKQRLSLPDGDRLVEEDSKPLKECGVVPINGSTGGKGDGGAVSVIDLDIAKSGGGFIAIDLLSAHLVTGEGVPKNYTWERFDLGMNLYGKCNRRDCRSSKLNREVVVKMGYGRIFMKMHLNQFECPVCRQELENNIKKKMAPFELGMVSPRSFLVCHGNALFRFKKAGVDEEIHSLTMESPGSTSSYITFDDFARTSDYDLIEVTTVGRNSSPFTCVYCNRRITKISQPVTLTSCQHSYHPLCLNKIKAEGDDCSICGTDVVASVKVLPWRNVTIRDGFSNGNKMNLGWNFGFDFAGRGTNAAVFENWDSEMEVVVHYLKVEEKIKKEEEIGTPMITRRGTIVKAVKVEKTENE